MWSNIFGARGVELTDTAALTPAVVAGLGTLFSNLAKRTKAPGGWRDWLVQVQSR